MTSVKNSPANNSVMPNSFNLFLVFSPRPVLGSTSTSESMGRTVAGSMISASTRAWSSPWRASTDFGGAFGSAGNGKDGSVAKGVGDRRIFGDSIRSSISASPAGTSSSSSGESLRLFLGLSSSSFFLVLVIITEASDSVSDASLSDVELDPELFFACCGAEAVCSIGFLGAADLRLFLLSFLRFK